MGKRKATTEQGGEETGGGGIVPIAENKAKRLSFELDEESSASLIAEVEAVAASSRFLRSSDVWKIVRDAGAAAVAVATVGKVRALVAAELSGAGLIPGTTPSE